MNILVDIRILTRNTLSGVAQYTINTINHLLDLAPQHKFKLFYNGIRKHDIRKSRILNLQQPNAILVEGKIPNKWLACWQPKIDRLINCDLVYSPHLDAFRTARKPHIMTIHDLSFIHHPYFFPNRYRFWHWLQNCRVQAQEAAAIVTDAQFTKNDIAETLRVPENKIHVIYPGVNFENHAPEARTLGKIKALRPYILYLGTLEPRKNVSAIVEAFNILKEDLLFDELKLVLAGTPGWLYEETFKRIKNSTHRQDIILLGEVSNEERFLLYNLAEVFVYPSFFEGFGLPPLEAQAAGCPVVASNRTSLPEILGGSALLIDPWEVNNLAHAIEILLTNSQLRQDKIAEGLSNAQKFTWTNTACELLKLFSQFSS